jgi:hypothetical protein
MHDRSLLQKRDPNSKACANAKKEAFSALPNFIKALQNYPHSDELTKVGTFQQAMIAANMHQDRPHYEAIVAAYHQADAALAASSEPKAARLRKEVNNMMDIVNKIAPLCK